MLQVVASCSEIEAVGEVSIIDALQRGTVQTLYLLCSPNHPWIVCLSSPIGRLPRFDVNEMKPKYRRD